MPSRGVPWKVEGWVEDLGTGAIIGHAGTGARAQTHKTQRNPNMNGTCRHRHVCDSSLDNTRLHIATSTAGQRGGPWRRKLDQRLVTRLRFPRPKRVTGHAILERRRCIASRAYRLAGSRQRAAATSPPRSTTNCPKRAEHRSADDGTPPDGNSCSLWRLRQWRGLSILCRAGSRERGVAPRCTLAPADLPLGALPDGTINAAPPSS